VATAQTRAWWTLALAVAGLVLAAVALVLAVAIPVARPAGTR
jgi:hypothetical protein